LAVGPQMRDVTLLPSLYFETIDNVTKCSDLFSEMRKFFPFFFLQYALSEHHARDLPSRLYGHS